MTVRLQRFALLALVPTAVDVALLLILRQHLGWMLVLANLVAITAASVLSYALHRRFTFRSDPFVRWVRMPVTFAAVAAAAALVDTAVLRGLFAAQGFTSLTLLLGAKAMSLSAAAVVRLALYRAALLGTVRHTSRDRSDRPLSPGDRRLSVVVPALDEAEGIRAAIAGIRDATVEVAGDGGVEIVVVDDGSSDGTADAALAGGADQVVVLPSNRGKGAATRAGVAVARGRTVAFIDADLAYSPDHLLVVLAEIEAGWDVAVGSRRHPDSTRVEGAGAVRDLGSRAVNLLAMAVLLSHPHDTQCGLKAFRSDVGKALFALGRVDRFAFDIELLHLVERHELSLVEVPVRLEVGERSTVRLLRDTLRLVRDLWRIRRWSAAGAYELQQPIAGSELLVGGR